MAFQTDEQPQQMHEVGTSLPALELWVRLRCGRKDGAGIPLVLRSIFPSLSLLDPPGGGPSWNHLQLLGR